ncbi:LamG domain-containing protein [bacterium]|nr:LamG domain-containing protein [bacterium]
MATSYSPKIITDGLVLCLDAADKKSLLAPPTTNLANNSNGTINWTTGNLVGTRTQSTVSANDYHYRFVLDKGSNSYISFRFSFDHTNLTNGETYIMSYKYKITSGSGTFRVTDFCDVGVTRVTKDIGDGWYYETAYASRSSYTETYDFFDVQASDNMTVDIKEIQVEHTSASSPLATPFVSYQRQWKDRAGSNNGTLVNMNDHSSYSSNNGGYLIFDGTDNEISFPEITLTTQWTISYWFYHNAASSYEMTIGKNGDAGNRFYHRDSGSDYKLRVHNNDNQNVVDMPMPDRRQKWTHLAYSMNGTNVTGWVNGEGSLNTTVSDTNTFVIDNLGYPYYTGNYYWLGYIGPVHVYNKQLTDTEALQNYNATKGRFGL